MYPMMGGPTSPCRQLGKDLTDYCHQGKIRISVDDAASNDIEVDYARIFSNGDRWWGTIKTAALPRGLMDLIGGTVHVKVPVDFVHGWAVATAECEDSLWTITLTGAAHE